MSPTSSATWLKPIARALFSFDMKFSDDRIVILAQNCAPQPAEIDSMDDDNRRSVADKRRTFQELHRSGCFVIPNPWDAGSARYLQTLGFKALATTSSGFAWSQGHADNTISRDMAIAHLNDIVAATDLPVNADFESGFAHDAAGVAESV